MNSQYTLDDRYLSCVASHMSEQRPFGDVPRKVSASVRRSMVATRTFSRAMRSANKIAEHMKKVMPYSLLYFSNHFLLLLFRPHVIVNLNQSPSPPYSTV